jgi:DNA-binding NarL/FixJ family response regulator
MATTHYEVSMSSPGNPSLPLTVEERRALSLSARGLSVTDVAEAMGISAAVVSVWLSSAIEKLGARSKLEAVIIAARRGEIDLSA